MVYVKGRGAFPAQQARDRAAVSVACERLGTSGAPAKRGVKGSHSVSPRTILPIHRTGKHRRSCCLPHDHSDPPQQMRRGDCKDKSESDDRREEKE